MKKSKHTPLDRLKHHVTGAIERGEKTPIIASVGATRGPWIVSKHGPTHVTSSQGTYICDASPGDATLIAAAPEMLEALEFALADLLRAKTQEERFYPSALAIGLLEEALKKARGDV